jgi:hypothetical protein
LGFLFSRPGFFFIFLFLTPSNWFTIGKTSGGGGWAHIFSALKGQGHEIIML